MSSVAFVDALVPVNSSRGVTLQIANVVDAAARAGFAAGFALSVDQEHNTKWVNPTPFVPLLVDGLRVTRAEAAVVKQSVASVGQSVVNARQDIDAVSARLDAALKANEDLKQLIAQFSAELAALKSSIDGVQDGVDEARERLCCLEGDTSNFGKFTDMFKTITADEPVVAEPVAEAVVAEPVAEAVEPVAEPVVSADKSVTDEPVAEQLGLSEESAISEVAVAEDLPVATPPTTD